MNVDEIAKGTKQEPEPWNNYFEYTWQDGIKAFCIEDCRDIESGDLVAYNSALSGKLQWVLMAKDHSGYRLKHFIGGIELTNPIDDIRRLTYPLEVVARPVNLIDQGDIYRIITNTRSILQGIDKSEDAKVVRFGLLWTWFNPDSLLWKN